MRTTIQNKTESTGFSASDYVARHRRPLNSGEQRRGLPSDLRSRSERPKAASPRTKKSRQKEFVLSPKAKLRLFVTALVLVIAVIVISGSVAAYNAIASSGWFTVSHIDLQGTVNVSRDDLMRRLNSNLSTSLWQLDLNAIRAEMERQPGVLKAEVVRVLPDTLRVTIEERKPVAPLRHESGTIVWVDQEGTTLGENTHVKMEHVPPVISGLESSNNPIAIENNRHRMDVYQKLLAELSESPSSLQEVDEINLSDWHSARLNLSARRVSIILGEEDYLARFKQALDVLDKVKHGDFSGVLKPSDAERLAQGARIAYLNVTRPNQVIAGLATE